MQGGSGWPIGHYGRHTQLIENAPKLRSLRGKKFAGHCENLWISCMDQPNHLVPQVKGAKVKFCICFEESDACDGSTQYLALILVLQASHLGMVLHSGVEYEALRPQ